VFFRIKERLESRRSLINQQILSMILNPNKPSENICEACGSDFSCGAGGEKCWCFNVKLDEEYLKNLQKIYNKCLCPDCLINKIELLLPHQISTRNNR
jgi:hypothetical protein